MSERGNNILFVCGPDMKPDIVVVERITFLRYEGGEVNPKQQVVRTNIQSVRRLHDGLWVPICPTPPSYIASKETVSLGETGLFSILHNSTAIVLYAGGSSINGGN